MIATAVAKPNCTHKLLAGLWRLSSLCTVMSDDTPSVTIAFKMLINPKSIDLNQKRKLKSASRPFNSLGSRFITAAPCFWHGAAERVVASITAAGKEPGAER
jgi:hypothetical protein